MESPLVTVIIPAYNAETYIGESLTSITKQTYQSLEIIVVDDGSTDNTAEIIKKQFPDVRYVKQSNSGSCASPRNNGLTLATGTYVTFLDADDRMVPGKIEFQATELEANPEAVMTVSNYRNFGSKQEEPDHFSTCPLLSKLLEASDKPYLVLDPETCRTILVEENFTIAGSPMYRRQDVLEEKGFDVSLRACEDFHLNYRVAMRGPVIINRTIGFERRMHDSNMSSDNERMLVNYVVSRTDLADIEKKPILKKELLYQVRCKKRALQRCLIQKRDFQKAISLYAETFPPISYQDYKHDIRQAIKLILMNLNVLK